MKKAPEFCPSLVRLCVNSFPLQVPNLFAGLSNSAAKYTLYGVSVPQNSPPSVNPSQVEFEVIFTKEFLIYFSFEELTPEPIIIVPFLEF